MDKKRINVAKIIMIANKIFDELSEAASNREITVKEILNIIENVINEFGYDLNKIAINL